MLCARIYGPHRKKQTHARHAGDVCIKLVRPSTAAARSHTHARHTNRRVRPVFRALELLFYTRLHFMVHTRHTRTRTHTRHTSRTTHSGNIFLSCYICYAVCTSCRMNVRCEWRCSHSCWCATRDVPPLPSPPPPRLPLPHSRPYNGGALDVKYWEYVIVRCVCVCARRAQMKQKSYVIRERRRKGWPSAHTHSA